MTDDERLAAALSALHGGDGRPAQQWLAECFRDSRPDGSPGLAEEQLERLARLEGEIQWGNDWSAEKDAELRALFPAAIAATGLRRHAPAVFALYLRHICEVAWELTSDHSTMNRVIGLASEVWAEQAPALGLVEAEQAEADACYGLLGFLGEEFAVESALFTGALDVIEQAVLHGHDRVVAVSAAAAAAASQGEGTSVVGVAVAEEAHRELVYFNCVRTAILATRDYLARRTATVAPAIAEIEAALAGPELVGIDASEIRSYLTALEELEAAADRDWLRVDEGRLIVLYPFGLRSPRSDTSQRVVEEAVEHGADWALGGLDVESASRLELSDAWQGFDSLGRGYGGAQLLLPDLELRTSGGRVQRIAASVQLSQLGNHMVRFELPLAAAGPSEIAELATAANPIYGDLAEMGGALVLVRADEAEGAPTRWSRLSDAAQAIIADVAEHYRKGTRSALSVSKRPGMFSVIAVVDRATAFAGIGDPAGRPVEDARALPGLFGAQPLLHPVPAETTSFADWASYDLDAVLHQRLLTLNQELLVSNANTVLLASFRSPSYRIGTVLSYLEFAHSLQGMYAGWQEEVAQHAQAIAQQLDDVDRLLAVDVRESAGQKEADELREVLVRIEHAELALQRFVQSNQAMALFIESPALVTSTPLRVDLDAALATSDYRELQAAFDHAKNEVLGNRLQQLLELCQRRIAEQVEAERVRQTASARRLLEAVGIGIAIIGLSGVVSILQAGYSIQGEGSLLLVGVLIGLAGLFALLSWWTTREVIRQAERRRRRRRRREAGG